MAFLEHWPIYSGLFEVTLNFPLKIWRERFRVRQLCPRRQRQKDLLREAVLWVRTSEHLSFKSRYNQGPVQDIHFARFSVKCQIQQSCLISFRAQFCSKQSALTRSETNERPSGIAGPCRVDGKIYYLLSLCLILHDDICLDRIKAGKATHLCVSMSRGLT